MAAVKTKYEFFGLSSIIQFVGVILLFWFPFGTLFGILLIIYGSAKSKKFICSECGYILQHKNIKLCQNCKATF